MNANTDRGCLMFISRYAVARVSSPIFRVSIALSLYPRTKLDGPVPDVDLFQAAYAKIT